MNKSLYNLDRVIQEVPVVQYQEASLDQAAETALIAAFMKLFVFAHEIGLL